VRTIDFGQAASAVARAAVTFIDHGLWNDTWVSLGIHELKAILA
jgi:hypothetical protein